MSTKKRRVRISFQISDEEYHSLQRHAERYGRGIAGYLIDLHRTAKGFTSMNWGTVFRTGYEHRAKEMEPQTKEGTAKGC